VKEKIVGTGSDGEVIVLRPGKATVCATTRNAKRRR